MRSKKFFATALVLGAAILSSLSVAQASTMLSLNSGATTINCGADAGCVSGSGGTSWTGTIDVFQFPTSSTGLTAGAIPQYDLDLSLNGRTTGASANVLTIVWGQDNYSALGQGVVTIGNTALTGTSALRIYADTANILHNATFNFSGCATCTLLGTYPANGTFTVNPSLASPYALSMVMSVTSTGGGTFSIDDHARIPEPGTMLLLGAGLFGMGLRGMRRKVQA